MSVNSNVARKLSDRILIDATKTKDLVAQSMMRDIAKEVAVMESNLLYAEDRIDEMMEELDSAYGKWIADESSR